MKARRKNQKMKIIFNNYFVFFTENSLLSPFIITISMAVALFLIVIFVIHNTLPHTLLYIWVNKRLFLSSSCSKFQLICMNTHSNIKGKCSNLWIKRDFERFNHICPTFDYWSVAILLT